MVSREVGLADPVERPPMANSANRTNAMMTTAMIHRDMLLRFLTTSMSAMGSYFRLRVVVARGSLMSNSSRRTSVSTVCWSSAVRLPMTISSFTTALVDHGLFLVARDADFPVGDRLSHVTSCARHTDGAGLRCETRSPHEGPL
jgi:hypothetical protein